MKTWKTVVLIGVVSFVLHYLIKYALFMDYHKAGIVSHHAPGPCLEVYEGAGGSEDLTVMSDGRVFITQGLYPYQKGKILYFDFLDPTHKVKDLPLIGNINKTTPHFHGLSVWKNSVTDVVWEFKHSDYWSPLYRETPYFLCEIRQILSLITLMAVNHAEDGRDYVEVFQFNEKSQVLRHIKSVSDPSFVFANDVVAVSESSFYVTLTIRWTKYEVPLLMSFGQIRFYDGRETRVVASGLRIPNGINISPDLKYIYMAELGTKRILSYKRKANNDLEYSEEVFVDSAVDNIEVDPKTGDLWVGSHPSILLLINHMDSNCQSKSPSQVFRIKTDGDKFKDVIEVYLNDGKQISASTVASVYKGRVIIGSLGSQLLLCDLNYAD